MNTAICLRNKSTIKQQMPTDDSMKEPKPNGMTEQCLCGGKVNYSFGRKDSTETSK